MDKNGLYNFSVSPLSAVLLAGYGTSTGDAKVGGSLSPFQNPERPEPLEQLITSGSTGSGQGIQGEIGGDEFILVAGGSFDMGSSESEVWRSQDEMQHSVMVDDFYLSPCEMTQDEYWQVMGANFSSLTGKNLPMEMVSWLDVVSYCNARSEKEGLEPAYEIGDGTISWDRSASGHRLPTEAEWEYACRADTVTPSNTQTSIGVEEANYWGDYPYMIGDSYFSQGNLETKPGVYRQVTTAVGSFRPNVWGLYDMHGNIGEWVWDCYGSYDSTDSENPAGPNNGTRRVNRDGGWSDFAKNLRFVYRATMPEDNKSYNIGSRLARNAAVLSGAAVMSKSRGEEDGGNGRVLTAYSSWGGNTRGVAREIERQTGVDLSEIEHDLTEKIIIPFCSHRGGKFGQSLTVIAKLAPVAEIREGLVISYSDGDCVPGGVTEWLEQNGIGTQ